MANTADHRRTYLLLILLWLALALPHTATRYSYDWDSSQFERGVQHFDISHHQPHPPGYPLWVLALKGLTPLAGHPNHAQVALALLFTAAGLLFFRSLAREVLGETAGLAATALVAFSPVVFVNAITPLTYAVDLFVSCAVAWFAARLWSGEVRWAPLAFAVTAIAAGFRQSGATFLLPLLFVALWRSWRRQPVYAVAAVLAGAACWLGWYVPTAMLTGGFARLAALTSAQMTSSCSKTSVLMGAPLIVNAKMVVEVGIYLTLGLVGLVLPLAVALLRGRGRATPRPPLPAWATPLYFGLWLAPNLAMLCLFHCPKSGYVLLSLPPLALLGAWLAFPALQHWRWTAAVVAVAILAGYFPYERFIRPQIATLQYLLLRSSPRLPGLLESSQREIRGFIDSMAGRPDEKLVFCLLRRPEAPDIRTVTYEFSDVMWADSEEPGLRVYAPHEGGVSSRVPDSVRAIGWLCYASGPPPEIRSRFPQARRLGGNELYSFWAAGLIH